MLNSISQEGMKCIDAAGKKEHIDVTSIIQQIRKHTMHLIEKETKQCDFDFKTDECPDALSFEELHDPKREETKNNYKDIKKQLDCVMPTENFFT